MGRRKTQAARTLFSSITTKMPKSEMLQALETLALTLGVEVRSEKGDFKGGLCRVAEKNLILLKKDDPIDQKIHILANELSQFNLENIYVIPALRQLINQVKDDLQSTGLMEE